LEQKISVNLKRFCDNNEMVFQMGLKEAPGLMPAIDMNTGKAVVYLNRLRGLEEQITAPKVGSEVIGGEMAYVVFGQLMNDIGLGDMAKVVDLQKGGTDVPEFIKRQIRLGGKYGYEAFIGSPLGSGHNPDALTEKEHGSLQAFVTECGGFGITPIVVLEMTQPGSNYFLRDGASEELAEISYGMGVRHFVAPATKPDRIKVYRGKIGEESNIISPGVGPQKTGDPVKDVIAAVHAGTDYPVIGRALYQSDDPVEMGKVLFDAVHNAYRERKGV
jgi:orotidine-5'-phosphate decarboxylase